MANPTNELKERLIADADRAVELVMSERDYYLGSGLGDQGQYFGRSTGETTYDTFATGYDSGLTVFPFRLDLSLLDGADLLA